MDFPALLKVLATQDGSDLYLSTGAPPCAKFNGVLKPLGTEALKPGDVALIADGIMDAEQRLDFERELEMNLAFSLSGIGRCRPWKPRGSSPAHDGIRAFARHP